MGLDQIERAKDTIEAGKDAQAFLGIVKIALLEIPCLQTFVDVALESEDCLFA